MENKTDSSQVADLTSFRSWFQHILFYFKAILGFGGVNPESFVRTSKMGAKDFYNSDSATYDLSRRPWITGYPGKIEVDTILPFTSSTKTILVSGAGTGRTVMNLARELKKKIIALDISRNMIMQFRCKLQETDLDICLVVADAESTPFRNEVFDAVICSRAIKFFPHPVKFLKEASRTIKDGNRIFVVSETSDSLLYRMIHKLSKNAVDPFDIRFSKQELISFFQKAKINIINIRPLISLPPWLYDAPKPILEILKKVDEKTGKYSHVWIIIGEKSKPASLQMIRSKNVILYE